MTGEVWYLHAIIADSVDEAALSCGQLVASDGLAAVLTPGPETPSVEDAIAHHELVVKLCRQTDVLPFQFGLALAHPSDARPLLRQEADRFRAALCGIARCSEYGIVLRRSAADREGSSEARDCPAMQGSGREYLRGRATRRNRRQARSDDRQAVADACLAEIASAARSHAARPSARAPELKDRMRELAVLVEHDRVDDLFERTAAASNRLETVGLEVEVTGPWPPYSFANLQPTATSGSAA